MFVFKSTLAKRLEEAAQLALEQQQLLRQGYAMRIAALEQHIEDLRKLVFSPTNAHEIPEIQEEADLVITQNEKYLPVTEEENKKLDEALIERDRLFSGNYDGVV